MKTEIDITREHCPMTFVKVKLALARLQRGDRLEVTLSEGEPLENVPKSAKELGHRILSTEKLGNSYRIIIEK